jgi:hypothetical protein
VERFTNARVHEWLAPALDATSTAMHTTRLQLNSAALWWFLHRLTAQERAEALGEYVKALALAHTDGPTNGEAAPPPSAGRRR